MLEQCARTGTSFASVAQERGLHSPPLPTKKAKWSLDWAKEFISETQWDYLTTTMGCVSDDGKIIKSVRIGKHGKSTFSPALVSALTEFGTFKESE